MRILVGMSGGVDSSVAAYMLKNSGFDVVGATMTLWPGGRPAGARHRDACFSPYEKEDVEAAAAVCEILGIPHRVFDCAAEYRHAVLSDFRAEYLAGRTPNPCVWCNAAIKFGVLPEAARKAGIAFDKFATGHYALLDDGRLRRARDEAKDQSYFLYRLTPEQLSGALFPLGGLYKAEVREVAARAGLAIKDKPDSQDFYAGDIRDLIDAPPRDGLFVSSEGKVLGRHRGHWRYTVGQRRGLGISSDRPLYVIAIDPEKNEVVLGHEEEGLTRGLRITNAVWQSGIRNPEREVFVKIRSAQKPVPASLSDGEVTFADPQRPVAPGQSAVFYDADGYVIGGGIVS